MISNGSSNQDEQNASCAITATTQADSPVVKIGKIVFLSIILLVSLIANTLIIAVVCKRRELRKTINYFIVNMAVSDFAFPLMGIPANLVGIVTNSFHWLITETAGSILCKLTRFLQDVSVTVSVQSLFWIALDRFMAVVFPMKIHAISSKSRTYAIASTWILAVILNARDFYTFGLQDFDGHMICIDDRTSQLYKNSTYVYISLAWVAPLIAITILYCVIGVALRRQDEVIGHSNVKQNNRRKRHAIKMSFCIVVTFYLFALLLITIQIMQAFDIYISLLDDPTYCSLYDVIWFFSISGFYLCSTTNPIICFAFVDSHRRGLKEIFISCRHLSQKKWNTKTGKLEQVTLKGIIKIEDNKSCEEAIDSRI